MSEQVRQQARENSFDSLTSQGIHLSNRAWLFKQAGPPTLLKLQVHDELSKCGVVSAAPSHLIAYMQIAKVGRHNEIVRDEPECEHIRGGPIAASPVLSVFDSDAEPE